MLLNARNDLFQLEFPKTFFPQELIDKWRPYIERFPTPIDNMRDFINFTIQGVNTSSLSYDVAQQGGGQKRAERKWRASTPIGSTSSKEFIISFQLVDGYANYFMLMELFDHWYSFYNKEKYCPIMTMYTFDGDGNRLIQFEMSDILFTNMQELQLNYSDNIQQFNSFDAQFEFNQYQIKFPFD